MVTGYGKQVKTITRMILLTHLDDRHDIHYTAQWSAPSPGGVTRLCADESDKKVRDWFRDQLLELGADYKVSVTGLALVPPR